MITFPADFEPEFTSDFGIADIPKDRPFRTYPVQDGIFLEDGIGDFLLLEDGGFLLQG